MKDKKYTGANKTMDSFGIKFIFLITNMQLTFFKSVDTLHMIRNLSLWNMSLLLFAYRSQMAKPLLSLDSSIGNRTCLCTVSCSRRLGTTLEDKKDTVIDLSISLVT